MTAMLERTVKPLVNKFYVYALFKKTSYLPFYVGKGKGVRINNHFKESALKVNSRKVQTIKKYKDTIRREILCYFDNEESAYDFEEYLIGYYGVVSEGGCLYNYAKTRYEFSKAFSKEVAAKGHVNRERTYDADTIFKVYNLYYDLHKTYLEISKETGVCYNYVGYIVRGKKCKSDYNNFLEVRWWTKEQAQLEYSKVKDLLLLKRRCATTISKEDITKMFGLVCSNQISLEDAAKQLNTEKTYLHDVFTGKKRVNLNLDCNLYKKNRKTLTDRVVEKNLNNIIELRNQGFSVLEIVKITGLSKTSVHRYLSKMSSGLNDGVGDTTGGDDNSSTNLDNTA